MDHTFLAFSCSLECKPLENFQSRSLQCNLLGVLRKALHRRQAFLFAALISNDGGLEASAGDADSIYKCVDLTERIYYSSTVVLLRRTRAVFDVAINVVHNIQQRDIEAGRNLGNLILRWLDRMKPSANIHGISCEKPTAPNSINSTKPTANRQQETLRSLVRSNARSLAQGSDRNLFSTTINTWPKSFPTIAMMLRSARPAGSTSQFRHLCINGAQVLRSSYGRPAGFDGVIRKDILEWMNGY